MLTDTGNSKYTQASAPPCGAVRWTGGFWKDVLDSCAESMVPQLRKMFEDKSISHVVENFRICAGEAQGDFDGTVFGDGDFYKWMEAECYAAYLLGDEERFVRLEKYVELIGKAQQEDGYISTKQIIESRQGAGGRMRDINEFEVYNMGHLFTSACIYFRVTGKDSFLKIAEKAAGYLQGMYDEAGKTGDVQTAVCPSHYMGLIELYRTTGKEQYLKLAGQAVELRDAVKDGMDDNQDRIPLKKQEKIIGHAVRASYLYAGVADLYAEQGDEEYLEMLRRVWRNMADTKLYLTGGIGALYNGTSPYGNFFKDQKIHQAFGYEYQLPNVTAYNETCASVGLVLWAYRMFLIEQRAEYMDVLERAMLNVNLAAVSLDGKKYFYENMLRRTKKLDYELVWPLTRSEYILSYCCPPNLARTIMESGEYAFVQAKDSVYTGLYGNCRGSFVLENGAAFTLEEETGYPYDGKILFRFAEVEKDVPISLKIRIPGWAEKGKAVVRDGGREQAVSFGRKERGSYLALRLDKLDRAEVELDLDMPVRYTMAHPKVEEDGNQLAVERGPMVYCMESQDCDIDTLDDIYLDPEAEYVLREIEVGGRRITALEGEAWQAVREQYDPEALYQTYRKPMRKKASVRMIPYFAWDNRGQGEMRIWMPYL